MGYGLGGQFGGAIWKVFFVASAARSPPKQQNARKIEKRTKIGSRQDWSVQVWGFNSSIYGRFRFFRGEFQTPVLTGHLKTNRKSRRISDVLIEFVLPKQISIPNSTF